MITLILFIVLGYLLGSISSAVIVCKLMGLPDPRLEGSNNPGATNVLRIGGKTAAILTLLGDLLKGFIPVILARLLGVQGFALGLVALAALLGHIFPVFFQFKGGKGVATAFGALLAMTPAMALVTAITWVLILVFTRYSSLAAIVSAILAPFYTLLFHGFHYFIPVLMISLILLWRHWENFQRLRNHTESKVNF